MSSDRCGFEMKVNYDGGSMKRTAWWYPLIFLLAIPGCGGNIPEIEEKIEKPDAETADPLDTDSVEETSLFEKYSLIQPGKFLMGAPEDEFAWFGDEILHEVQLTRAFLVSRTEVTHSEWRAVIGNNPSKYTYCGDDCPVEQVSWYDALAFCNALSKSEGLTPCYDLHSCTGEPGAKTYQCSEEVTWSLDCEGYRLPTEAEWEYAARAGTKSALPNGLELVPESHPNFGGTGCDPDANADLIAWSCNSSVDYAECFDFSSQGHTWCAGPHPVGLKPPNNWGLFDTSGNVSEWVWDCYAAYQIDGTHVDPVGNCSGKRLYEVASIRRGGSWWDAASQCRNAIRSLADASEAEPFFGFRVVRTVLDPSALE